MYRYTDNHLYHDTLIEYIRPIKRRRIKLNIELNIVSFFIDFFLGTYKDSSFTMDWFYIYLHRTFSDLLTFKFFGQSEVLSDQFHVCFF